MVNDKVLISIIVPLHNMEGYIDECLESILSQVDERVEVIVCDDASTDESLKKVKKRWEDRVRIVEIKENIGLLKARIKGLGEARGKYVLFVDADDKLADGAIKKYFELMGEDDYDIIRGGFYGFDDSGKRKDVKRHPNQIVLEKDKKELVYKPALTSIAFFSAWGQIIRREVIDIKRLKKINLAMGEDQVLNYACYQEAKKIRLSDEILYGYRTNMGSMTHDKSKMRAIRNMDDTFKMCKYITEFYLEIDDKELIKLAYIKYLRDIDLYFLRLVRDARDMKLAEEKCREIMTHSLTEEARRVLTHKDIYCKKMKILLECILDNKEKRYLRIARMVARFAK